MFLDAISITKKTAAHIHLAWPLVLMLKFTMFHLILTNFTVQMFQDCIIGVFLQKQLNKI